MRVTVTFFFSFPNYRLKRTHNSTNIKGISQESSINRKTEAYTFTKQYTTKNEISFRQSLESGLTKYVRESPSVTKCKFECDYVPDNKLFLPKKFNRKLTPAHVINI